MYALYRIYALTALAVGEIAALVGLDRGVRKDALDALIWLALLIGVLGVTVPLMRRQWDYLERYWARIRYQPVLSVGCGSSSSFVVPMAFFTFWLPSFSLSGLALTRPLIGHTERIAADACACADWNPRVLRTALRVQVRHQDGNPAGRCDGCPRQHPTTR